MLSLMVSQGMDSLDIIIFLDPTLWIILQQ